jgi:hypothetical protein
MRIILKAVAILALLGALGLVGYAVFFELPAPQRDVTVPVEPR